MITSPSWENVGVSSILGDFSRQGLFLKFRERQDFCEAPLLHRPHFFFDESAIKSTTGSASTSVVFPVGHSVVLL